VRTFRFTLFCVEVIGFVGAVSCPQIGPSSDSVPPFSAWRYSAMSFISMNSHQKILFPPPVNRSSRCATFIFFFYSPKLGWRLFPSTLSSSLLSLLRFRLNFFEEALSFVSFMHILRESAFYRDLLLPGHRVPISRPGSEVITFH